MIFLETSVLTPCRHLSTIMNRLFVLTVSCSPIPFPPYTRRRSLSVATGAGSKFQPTTVGWSLPPLPTQRRRFYPETSTYETRISHNSSCPLCDIEQNLKHTLWDRCSHQQNRARLFRSACLRMPVTPANWRMFFSPLPPLVMRGLSFVHCCIRWHRLIDRPDADNGAF